LFSEEDVNIITGRRPPWEENSSLIGEEIFCLHGTRGLNFTFSSANILLCIETPILCHSLTLKEFHAYFNNRFQSMYKPWSHAKLRKKAC
jgi:hypothetical protein